MLLSVAVYSVRFIRLSSFGCASARHELHNRMGTTELCYCFPCEVYKAVTRMTTKPILILLLVLQTSCLVMHAQECSPCHRRGIHCRLPAQDADAAKVELGSKTAKDGFRNEDEIRDKFNTWQTDTDARAWLAAMNYEIADIDNVTASKPHGEKADVEVTKAGNLKIGRITMQRKGGDNGRDTANMLQFKINPVQLFELK